MIIIITISTSSENVIVQQREIRERCLGTLFSKKPEELVKPVSLNMKSHTMTPRTCGHVFDLRAYEKSGLLPVHYKSQLLSITFMQTCESALHTWNGAKGTCAISKRHLRLEFFFVHIEGSRIKIPAPIKDNGP